MKKQYRVGIIGATGMVGQRFATLLENHPWFDVTALGGQFPFGWQNVYRSGRRTLGHGDAYSRFHERHGSV